MPAIGIGISSVFGYSGFSRAALLAGAESDALAGSFLDDSLAIRDTVTPANNFAGTPFSKLTYTCGSVANYYNSAGLLAQAAINTPRYNYDPATLAIRGLLIEEARTNSALWCRDLTNAVWAASSMGASKTATGIDGAANSATTITASGASATILQTLVLTNTCATAFSIRRRTGTGTIEITQDGTTWVVVTPTSAWQRFTIASAALINPVIGIRITTSGDAVDVDFAQIEVGSRCTSPIATAAAAVTRSAGSLTIPVTSFNFSQTNGTLYTKTILSVIDSASSQIGLEANNGTGAELYRLSSANGTANSQFRVVDNSVQQASVVMAGVTVNTPMKLAAAFAASDFRAARNGVLGTPVVSGTLPTPTQLTIGHAVGFGHLNDEIQEFMVVPRSMTNAELQSLST